MAEAQYVPATSGFVLIPEAAVFCTGDRTFPHTAWGLALCAGDMKSHFTQPPNPVLVALLPYLKVCKTVSAFCHDQCHLRQDSKDHVSLIQQLFSPIESYSVSSYSSSEKSGKHCLC